MSYSDISLNFVPPLPDYIPYPFGLTSLYFGIEIIDSNAYTVSSTNSNRNSSEKPYGKITKTNLTTNDVTDEYTDTNILRYSCGLSSDGVDNLYLLTTDSEDTNVYLSSYPPYMRIISEMILYYNHIESKNSPLCRKCQEKLS